MTNLRIRKKTDFYHLNFVKKETKFFLPTLTESRPHKPPLGKQFNFTLWYLTLNLLTNATPLINTITPYLPL